MHCNNQNIYEVLNKKLDQNNNSILNTKKLKFFCQNGKKTNQLNEKNENKIIGIKNKNKNEFNEGKEKTKNIKNENFNKNLNPKNSYFLCFSPKNFDYKNLEIKKNKDNNSSDFSIPQEEFNIDFINNKDDKNVFFTSNTIIKTFKEKENILKNPISHINVKSSFFSKKNYNNIKSIQAKTNSQILIDIKPDNLN